jgi:acetoin utilization deacetylase AcuC-like enzyme
VAETSVTRAPSRAAVSAVYRPAAPAPTTATWGRGMARRRAVKARYGTAVAGDPVFLEHPSSLQHDTGPHPEQPARITAIQQELEARDWVGYTRVSSPPAAHSALTAVHPERYVETIESIAARGGGQLDLDTVMSAGSYEAALHAAGGAVRLAEMLVAGEAPTGFSAHRPPGHHATRTRAMGFCLFSNIAVAAQYALDSLGLSRVLIFDWDVHHGNGTNDIFYMSDQVLFVSIHQSPLWPGTGAAGDVGAGAGRGFTVNLPVPPGTGDADYRSLVSHVVVPLARAFEPQLALVSAGFDAHIDDPLADCRVSDEGFAEMAALMREVCRELGVPLGAVLEGGYALGALSRGVANTMTALAGKGDADADGDPSSVELTPLASAALERVVEFWPALRAG